MEHHIQILMEKYLMVPIFIFIERDMKISGQFHCLTLILAIHQIFVRLLKISVDTVI